MENKMRNAEWKQRVCFFVRFISFTAVTLFFLAGCAEKGPILLEIPYQPPAATLAAASKTVVGVGLFKDDRGKPASVLGKRKIADGVEDDFVVAGTVSGLVTARVKDAFQARGFRVKDSSWNGTEEGIKDEGADLLISGEVKTFGVDSVSKPFKTAVKAVVQIKIVVADTAAKKIIRTLDVNSVVEQDMFYSREKLNNVLSEALSAALNQIFKDDALKKKFQ